MYVATSSRRAVQNDVKTWQAENKAVAAEQSSGGGLFSVAAALTAAATDAENDSFQWEFRIPKGCWQARRIQNVSVHKDEYEVLIVPWSAVHIKKKRFDADRRVTTIFADVLEDASEERPDLPTIVA